MGDRLVDGLVTILVATVGLATVAVIVSKNNNTSQILTAGGSAWSGILGAATSPGTGGSSFSNLNFSSM